ncbi:MAG: tetratricopeptide repeat protein [Lewinella sp.]|nr:tetratricopeptide repeat protein [Lewinella sp.]
MLKQTSIAVLPFDHISADAEDAYLADGITEELINALGKIEGLKVTARTSSFAYKGKKKDVRIIGNELGVATVLEGSIRKAGKRLRIATQLIRTDNGFHIWSARFDRELTDIFALQDEISLLIAEKIRENFGHLDIADHLVQARTENMEAYQQYLKGRFYQLNWRAEDFNRAVSCYQLSITLDPAFYQPYFGLVQCYGIMAAWNFMDKDIALATVDEYMRQGLALAPESPEAYFAQATRALWVNWEPEDALRYLDQALAIAPHDTESLESAAEAYTALGRFDEALAHIRQALEYNPLSANHYYTRGNAYYLQGRFQEALRWMDEALALDPHWDLALQVKACCYVLREDQNALFRLLKAHPNMPNAADLRLLYTLRNENQHPPPAEAAQPQFGYLPWDVYTPLYLGDTDAALAALRHGIEGRIGPYINFRYDPLLAPLRTHPTYQRLCQDTFPAAAVARPVAAVREKPAAGLAEAEIRTAEAALRTLMEEARPYLSPELTLKDLAGQIDLHPNKLSWLLNEVMGQNFSEFINGYRLAAFQAKARQPAFDHYTLLGLAYECGFNSKSVFNEFFKKSTGQTPSAWRKANR